jgi:DNA-binding MarR family transcriptional regulator
MVAKPNPASHPEKSLPTRARQGVTANASSSASQRAHRAPSLPDFDPLIHERIRLGILSALAVNDSLSFNDLKQVLNTTDGNLSVHARKLEEADYVRCDKSFEGRTPRTTYRLTANGRRALEKYLDHMESLIKLTREK